MLLPQAPSGRCGHDLAPLSWVELIFRIHLLHLSCLWHVTLPRKALQPASKAKRFCKAHAKVLRIVVLGLLGVGEDFPALRPPPPHPFGWPCPQPLSTGHGHPCEGCIHSHQPHCLTTPHPTTPVHESYQHLTVLLPFLHLPKAFAVPLLLAPCAHRQLKCCHQ